MNFSKALRGVYAAALTPLDQNFSLIFEELAPFLEHLARRGCHGALLFGTTGEGPSFSPSERKALLHLATQFRNQRPDFHLLVGTGTPSLEETIELTRAAFDLGMDGVVVLPPYYFRNPGDEGLYLWYSCLLERAVPEGSPLFAYHIPGTTGTPLSLDLLARLLDAFPTKFAGLKDSSGDPEFALSLGRQFGQELMVFTGNDKVFPLSLKNQAAGCITALANLYSPELRALWDLYQAGLPADRNLEWEGIVNNLNKARQWLDNYPPAPPVLKAALAHFFSFSHWAVRPPLLPLPAEKERQALFAATHNIPPTL
jgi:4-hydroxy-tetrahydrodipicolinate synthase